MSLAIADLEKLQSEHPELQFELRDGEIIVMSPSDYASEEIGGTLLALLLNWVKPRCLGRVTGSSAGFRMPNSDLVAPDVAFVSADKLRESPRTYAEIVPDLIVEIKSSTDSVKKLKTQIEKFLEVGVKIGVFIDPDQRTITIYRPDSEPVELKDGDRLTFPDLLPD